MLLVIKILGAFSWILIVAILLSVKKSLDTEIELNEFKLKTKKYNHIWERMKDMAITVTHSYTSDPRYESMKVHVIYDNIKQIVMDSVTDIDKVHLKMINPQYEYQISLMILSEMRKGYVFKSIDNFIVLNDNNDDEDNGDE